jgi:hypothetical protein
MEVGSLACHKTHNKASLLVPVVMGVDSLSCRKAHNKKLSLAPGVMAMDNLVCHMVHSKKSSLAPEMMEVHSLSDHKACNKNFFLVPVLVEVGNLVCCKVEMGNMKIVANDQRLCSCPWDNVIRQGLFPPIADVPQLKLMDLVLTSSTLQHE